MKSKAANARTRNGKQTVVQPTNGGLIRAVAGAVSGASTTADDAWRTEPFKLDRAWLEHGARYAVLIAWTFVASVVLAGFLPSIFSQAFDMPVTSFPEVAMSAGTFMIFALIRAGLSLRIVDHVVRVSSVVKWVVFSVLSDALFQFVLLRLLPLSPLAFNDSASIVAQFASTAIGGVATGWLQWRMFAPKTKSQLVWVLSSVAAWTLMLAVLGLIAVFVLGRPAA
jgi:hypothetical protein